LHRHLLDTWMLSGFAVAFLGLDCPHLCASFSNRRSALFTARSTFTV